MYLCGGFTATERTSAAPAAILGRLGPEPDGAPAGDVALVLDDVALVGDGSASRGPAGSLETHINNNNNSMESKTSVGHVGHTITIVVCCFFPNSFANQLKTVFKT